MMRCENLEASEKSSKSSPTASKLEEGSTLGNGVTFMNMVPSSSSGEGLPGELARVLLRAGHDPHSVNLIYVYATTTLHDKKASQRPAPAMRTSANRLSLSAPSRLQALMVLRLQMGSVCAVERCRYRIMFSYISIA